MNRKRATRLSVIPVPSGQFTWSRNLLFKGFYGLDAELPCLWMRRSGVRILSDEPLISLYFRNLSTRHASDAMCPLRSGTNPVHGDSMAWIDLDNWP